ncbi:MAG: hypothetical protein IBJ10_01285 [Phycisphaerales bacterium]|nr:hypothetical protein [Phycisphaerales bacterium]
MGRLMERLYRGEWFEALVCDRRTQHLFRHMERHGGRIAPLLEKLNIFRLAVNMHADITGLNPVTLDVPGEFEAQWERLRAIRAASLFDAAFHEALKCASLYGAAPFRVDRAPGSSGGGAVVTLDDPAETFALGEDGPDGQPTVWERRWTVRREDAAARRVRTCLRVQRHRVSGTGGVVEEEAYAVDGGGCDLLADLRRLRRVALAEALGTNMPAGLRDSTPTGVPFPLLVRIANSTWRGEPEARLPEAEIDLIDQTAASLSQVARAMAQHAAPKLRWPERLVGEDGVIDATIEAFADPDKEAEYIEVKFAFEPMLRFLDRALQNLATAMEITPALLGVEVQSGQAADSYRKLALKATQTLAAARRGVLTIKPALERLWTIASAVDSASGLTVGGYDVAPVEVILRPEIPRERIDAVEEQEAMLRAGLTSRFRAIAELHGEDQAEVILAEIEAEEGRAAQRQQTALFGAAFGDPRNPEPSGTVVPPADNAPDAGAAA